MVGTVGKDAPLTAADFRFFAVEPGGVLHPLPVPAGSASFADLLEGLPLGVYSALRTFSHSKFLYLNKHLDRTERSMQALGWVVDWDRAGLCRAIDTATTAVPWTDSRVRFDVLARPAPKTLGTGSRLLLALMKLVPIPEGFYERGVAVALASELTRENPTVKAAEFGQRRAAFVRDRHEGVYEYILLSKEGYLLEGTGTNFWGVRDGNLYTAGSGVLEGITRQIILQIAPSLGIPVRLQAVHRHELDTLDEAAISGSSRAFLPAVQIDAQVIGNGRPGPVSRQILAAYNDFLDREIRPAIEQSSP